MSGNAETQRSLEVFCSRHGPSASDWQPGNFMVELMLVLSWREGFAKNEMVEKALPACKYVDFNWQNQWPRCQSFPLLLPGVTDAKEGVAIESARQIACLLLPPVLAQPMSLEPTLVADSACTPVQHICMPSPLRHLSLVESCATYRTRNLGSISQCNTAAFPVLRDTRLPNHLQAKWAELLDCR